MENFPLKVALAVYTVRNKTRRWLKPLRFYLLNLRIRIGIKIRSFIHSLDPARVRLSQVEKELEMRLDAFKAAHAGETTISDDDPEVQSLMALSAEVTTLRSVIRGGSIYYYEP